MIKLMTLYFRPNLFQRLITLLLLIFLQGNPGSGQVFFGSQNIITVGAEPVAAYPADIDGDGDLDLVSATRLDGKIAWHENEDGLGTFGPQQVIVAKGEEGVNILVEDMDGDGDLDVLAATAYYSRLTWYENVDGLGHFSGQVIISETVTGVQAVYVADIDGDGDNDIIASLFDQFRVVWYENEDGLGSFGTEQTISTEVEFSECVIAADMDNDGDQDVIYTSKWDYKIFWHENLDGEGNFGPQQIIFAGAYSDSSIRAADLDNDGDLDLCSASLYASMVKIAWFENLDGKGTFGPQNAVSTHFHFISSIYISDMDSDGDQDILAASESFDQIVWFENVDGVGDFGSPNVIPTTVITSDVDRPHFVHAADFDGDGDADVVSTSINDNKIAWYRNEDGAGNFAPEEVIFSYLPDRVQSVYSADIDSDGDVDLFSASDSDGRLSWYENINGSGQFGAKTTIDSGLIGQINVSISDLNGDGHLDVLSTSSFEDKLAWYRHEDGAGSFSDQQIISQTTENVTAIKSADLDQDGDMDVVVTSHTQNKLSWYENENGMGSFSSEQVISEQIYSARLLEVTDMDNDGLLDLVCSSYQTGEIVWFQNLNASGDFSSKKIISSEADYATAMATADVDGDGDPDLVTTLFYDKTLVWYENLDGLGNFGAEQLIANLTSSPRYLQVADFDHDGDVDIVACPGRPALLFENEDGAGTFGNGEIILDSPGGISSVVVADVNSDTHLDLFFALFSNHKIIWLKNLFAYPVASGVCFFDQNQNKQFDADEFGLPNISISIEPDYLARFTDQEGIFQFPIENEDYFVTARPDANWLLTTDSVSYHIAAQDTIIQQLDFGFYPVQEIVEVSPDLISAPTRCGFKVPFWLSYENKGTTFPSGFVSLRLDGLTSLVSADPAPDSTAGNTLFWNFENLAPSISDQINLVLQMPGVYHLGDTLSFDAISFVENDLGELVLNTTFQYQSVINCAYDPNDKLVQPQGIQSEGLTLFGEEFEYTVRFQNTGTDTAFTVRIEDQLDDDLDWTTFRPIAASHPYQTTLHSDGKVEFLFPNILLPDSTINEPESHGFVKYRIQHRAGLPENTEITNTAGIFFDFNPPMITNTTLNTLVSKIVGVNGTEKPVEVKVFPNPYSDFTTLEFGELGGNGQAVLQLLNMDGQVLQKYLIRSHSTLQLGGAHLLAGIYFYNIKNAEGAVLAAGKLVKQ